jgi:hypothetical protein
LFTHEQEKIHVRAYWIVQLYIVVNFSPFVNGYVLTLIN